MEAVQIKYSNTGGGRVCKQNALADVSSQRDSVFVANDVSCDLLWNLLNLDTQFTEFFICVHIALARSAYVERSQDVDRSYLAFSSS